MGYSNIFKHRPIGGNVCNTTPASDCVNHDILLAKLHFNDMHGTGTN